MDTENKYDFLCRNIDVSDRKEVIYALTFDRFKFNWLNPTGHWRLDLCDSAQRALFMNIVAINTEESDYSKHRSGRGDTSQKVRVCVCVCMCVCVSLCV